VDSEQPPHQFRNRHGIKDSEAICGWMLEEPFKVYSQFTVSIVFSQWKVACAWVFAENIYPALPSRNKPKLGRCGPGYTAVHGKYERVQYISINFSIGSMDSQGLWILDVIIKVATHVRKGRYPLHPKSQKSDWWMYDIMYLPQLKFSTGA